MVQSLSMTPEDREKYVGETHTTYPLTVEVGGHVYTLAYHESHEPTEDLVVLLPGLTDDSGDTVREVMMNVPNFPFNYLTLRYEAPFSLDGYTEVIAEAIQITGNKRVVLEGYCLGGAVLGQFLTHHQFENGEKFDIVGAIFRSSIIDRVSFKGRLLQFLLSAQGNIPRSERILRRVFPAVARLYPRAELSGQAAAGLVDYKLVIDELDSLPETASICIPENVRVYYIGLDKDKVADNGDIIERLGLGERPKAVRILRSSTTGTTHHPEDYQELFRTQAEMIQRGFDVYVEQEEQEID